MWAFGELSPCIPLPSHCGSWKQGADAPMGVGWAGMGGWIPAHLRAGGTCQTPRFVTVLQTGQQLRTLLVTCQLPT